MAMRRLLVLREAYNKGIPLLNKDVGAMQRTILKRVTIKSTLQ
jgi:hypothetical protein